MRWGWAMLSVRNESEVAMTTNPPTPKVPTAQTKEKAHEAYQRLLSMLGSDD